MDCSINAAQNSHSFNLTDSLRATFLSENWEHRTCQAISLGEDAVDLGGFEGFPTLLNVVSYVTLLLLAGAFVWKITDYFSAENSRVIEEKKPPPSQLTLSQNNPVSSHPPSGFPNYGNSCWLATGLQLIFSSPNIEEEMRKPLERKDHKEVREHKLHIRKETDEELECRKNLQFSFIHLFEHYQSGEQSEIRKATQGLHDQILSSSKILFPKLNFPQVGEPGTPHSIFTVWGKVFSSIQCFDGNLLAPESTHENASQKTAKRLLELAEPPKYFLCPPSNSKIDPKILNSPLSCDFQ